MALSVGEETPEQVIARMARELEHVREQSRVSHRMFVYYKREFERAERLGSRMEKALNTWRRKLLGIPKGQRQISEEELDLWASVEPETTEANTRDEYGPV